MQKKIKMLKTLNKQRETHEGGKHIKAAENWVAINLLWGLERRALPWMTGPVRRQNWFEIERVKNWVSVSTYAMARDSVDSSGKWTCSQTQRHSAGGGKGQQWLCVLGRTKTHVFLMRDSQLFGHVNKRKGRVEKFISPTVLVYLGINLRNEFLWIPPTKSHSALFFSVQDP